MSIGNNLYGYADYDGPSSSSFSASVVTENNNNRHPVFAQGGDDGAGNDHENDNGIEYDDDHDDDGDDDDNPLRVGQWMDGDSLAPPCGTNLPVVHSLLQFISTANATTTTPSSSENNNNSEVLYDLGCGDGRICLEACDKFHYKHVVGVEIEDDLIRRFQELVWKWKRGRHGRRQRQKQKQQLKASGEEGGGEEEEEKEDEVIIRPIKADLRVVLDKLLRKAEEINNMNNETKKEKSGFSKVVTSDEYDGNTKSDENGVANGDHDDSTNDDSSLHDLPLPTIIVMYLLPEAIQQIEGALIRLLHLIPNLRIVCNTWGLKSIQATEEVEVENTIDERNSCGSTTTLLRLYTCKSLR